MPNSPSKNAQKILNHRKYHSRIYSFTSTFKFKEISDKSEEQFSITAAGSSYK